MRCWVPPVYRDTFAELDRSQWWTEDQIADLQLTKLRRMLTHCATHVPYYRRLFRELGFNPDIQTLDNLRQIPFLDKDTVRSHANELVADNVPSWKRTYITTGGTTGKPLGIRTSRDSYWRERAFSDSLWSRTGFCPSDLRAALRGSVIESAPHWVFDPKERAYHFSTFHLTPSNAIAYARVIEERGIRFLHAYPSAAINFAQLLQRAGRQLPRLRALFLVSENLYPGQREFLEAAFNCRVYSFYGHTEAVIIAGECEKSTDYHLLPEYGMSEIVSPDGERVGDAETGELVGTSFHNFIMPFIRYRTGDSATIVPGRCRCGRAHPLIRNVRGRWLQEMIVGRIGNLISITSLNLHSDVFDRVEQFQFHQREPGKVRLNLIPASGFSEQDTADIRKALLAKMGTSVDLEITLTEEIALTARGKFRFVVQELPVSRSQGIQQ